MTHIEAVESMLLLKLVMLAVTMSCNQNYFGVAALLVEKPTDRTP